MIISRRSEAIQIVFFPTTSRMSTVRHIEMHSPIAAARSPRRGMLHRGRRLRYVRLHRASVDRIFVTPMTRAASRSFQWHGRRSRLSVYTKPRASRRRATRRRSATLQICPLRIARASSAESKQLSFKVVLERTARNAVFEEGNQREETKQKKKKRSRGSQGWIFLLPLGLYTWTRA